MRIFILYVLTVFTLSAHTMNYNEKIDLEKKEMEKEYSLFFRNFSSFEKYDIIDNYIRKTNIYLDTLFSKPPLYIYKELSIDFYGHFFKFYSENIAVLANSNYFSVYSFNGENFNEIFKSERFERIHFIDILDSDNDGIREIFIISDNGIYDYGVNNGQVRLNFIDENLHNISALYRVDLNKRNILICGKVMELSPFIYRPDSEKLYIFKWLYPGYDRKNLLSEEDFRYRKIYFHDINRDTYVDMITSCEKNGRIFFRIYLNDHEDRFDEYTEYDVEKSGFIDLDFIENRIFILTVDSIMTGKYEFGNLIIDKNSFNIDGCLAFHIEGDSVFLFTVDGKVRVLRKLV